MFVNTDVSFPGKTGSLRTAAASLIRLAVHCLCVSCCKVIRLNYGTFGFLSKLIKFNQTVKSAVIFMAFLYYQKSFDNCIKRRKFMRKVNVQQYIFTQAFVSCVWLS